MVLVILLLSFPANAFASDWEMTTADTIPTEPSEPAPSAPLQPEGGDLTFYDPSAPEIIGGGEEEIPAMAATTSTTPDPDEQHECIVDGALYSFRNVASSRFFSMYGYDGDNAISTSTTRGYDETFELIETYSDPDGAFVANYKIKTLEEPGYDDDGMALQYEIDGNNCYLTAENESYLYDEVQSWRIYSVDESSFVIAASSDTSMVLTFVLNVKMIYLLT